ncbi:MAG: isocitrate/isopropylmalate dehydrogenase family protein [Granulosicoccus sp.]
MIAELRVALLPGDGIGEEVIKAAQTVLQHVEMHLPRAALQLDTYAAGAAHYQEAGVALPDATLKACEQADAILLGAMGMPDIRYSDGTEISPQLDLRDHFQLFAGVRPIRAVPGLPLVLSDPRCAEIDMVLIREQTEGLFFGRGTTQIEQGVAYDTMAISESGSRRISNYALHLASRRGPRHGADRPRVTLVDKANVLGSMAFFRQVFLDVSQQYPSISTDCAYIDATALNLVRKPWELDVMVTENQFGDILSDLCAGLIGGMGMAPSADIGDTHAMFQPAHGSAPDIAGMGIANPTATLLSAAMMYDWLGEKHAEPQLVQAGHLLREAVDSAYADGNLLPAEFGGNAATDDIVQAVLGAIDTLVPQLP